MRKKIILGAIVLAAVAVVVIPRLFAEKIGVAEIAVRENVSLNEATLQKALADSTDCAGFKVTEIRQLGEGKVLARIGGMRGGCCLNPVRAALAKVAGVEKVQVRLLPKSEP